MDLPETGRLLCPDVTHRCQTGFRYRWEDLTPFVTFGPNQPKLRPGTRM